MFLKFHLQKAVYLSYFNCLSILYNKFISYDDQDMVLLHHEIQVESPDGQRKECRKATFLEFGRIENGKITSAMARTVGIPIAIGALVTTYTCFLTIILLKASSFGLMLQQYIYICQCSFY